VLKALAGIACHPARGMGCEVAEGEVINTMFCQLPVVRCYAFPAVVVIVSEAASG
jgi:hypothetical protein